MKRVHLIVSGRVQGVWYRSSTQEKAQQLGLTGWVRNVPGGQVEIVAEGKVNSVDTLVSWASRGPSLARVDHLKVEEEAYAGEFEDFGVRH